MRNILELWSIFMQPFFLIIEVWISWCKQIISFVLQWSPVLIWNFSKMCGLLLHFKLKSLRTSEHSIFRMYSMYWFRCTYMDVYKHLSLDILNSHKRYYLRWQYVCKPTSWAASASNLKFPRHWSIACPREWMQFKTAFQNAVKIACIHVGLIMCVEKIVL